MAEVLYAELSYRIMGVVFEVHNALGPGFGESIYEEALAHEFAKRGIPFERQKSITVRYKDVTVGEYRLDFLVDGKIIVELKAVSEMSSLFSAQVLRISRQQRCAWDCSSTSASGEWSVTA